MKQPYPGTSWVAHASPAAAPQITLLCFPFAGGGATFFREWGRWLGPEIEVWPIEYPGRWSRMREPLCVDAVDLAERALLGLGERLPPRFAVLGHSMGALVAFEFVRALRRRGARLPERLIASSRKAPHAALAGPPLHELDDERMISTIAARYGGLDPRLLQEPELMAMLAPILRADLRVHEAYRHYEEPPLALPVLALGGRDDTRVSEQDLQDWSGVSTAAFSLEMHPGGHFHLEKRSEALGRQLRAALLSGE
ncbi:thioesterase II family protein [Nannocystis pusilla]|uniref:thioesterase II family protein n=1 Tax=Nannocystis pusilla TaxID=889268 RepID=UPI003DA5D2C5